MALGIRQTSLALRLSSYRELRVRVLRGGRADGWTVVRCLPLSTRQTEQLGAGGRPASGAHLHCAEPRAVTGGPGTFISRCPGLRKLGCGSKAYSIGISNLLETAVSHGRYGRVHPDRLSKYMGAWALGCTMVGLAIIAAGETRPTYCMESEAPPGGQRESLEISAAAIDTSAISDTDQCPVCQEAVSGLEWTGCPIARPLHRFHAQCMHLAMMANPNCPVCRAPLDEEGYLYSVGGTLRIAYPWSSRIPMTERLRISQPLQHALQVEAATTEESVASVPTAEEVSVPTSQVIQSERSTSLRHPGIPRVSELSPPIPSARLHPYAGRTTPRSFFIPRLQDQRNLGVDFLTRTSSSQPISLQASIFREAPLPVPHNRQQPRSLLLQRDGENRRPTPQTGPVPVPMIAQEISLFGALVPSSSTSRISTRRASTSTTASVEERRRAEMLLTWMNIVQDLGSSSSLFTSVQGSAHADSHIERALDRISSRTMTRHFGVWQRWPEWCRSMAVQPGSPAWTDLADFLHELAAGSLVDRGTQRRSSTANTLAAISFVAWYADARTLWDCTQITTIRAFMSESHVPRERREAIPLTLAIVTSFERRVLEPQTEEHEILLLGFFLTLIWGALRFMDGQRCRPSSLLYDREILRGCCWSTKTSRSGQPWGIMASGCLGSAEENWGKRWFQAITSWRRRVEETTGSTPDFLLPDMGAHRTATGPTILVLARPMSYIKCLGLFRKALQSNISGSPYPAEQARDATLHSCKATTLSWARQLHVPEELRSEQGHHRAGSGRASVRLYSRDDVFGGLECQRLVIAGLRGGFRPAAPQGRGGQLPITEPEVSLPAIETQATTPVPSIEEHEEGPVVDLATGRELPEHRPLEDDSEAASSTDSAESLPEETLTVEVFLQNWATNIFHGAVPWLSPQHGNHTPVEHEGRFWRTACAASARGSRSLTLVDVPHSGAQPCHSPACRRMLVD